MSNIFLDDPKDRDVETAIMLEKAKVTDIRDAVAFTDGNRMFINTDENLTRLLPAYNKGMLKWLLWHERYHMELKHHNRFFKYLKELSKEETEKKFQITKEEVNIIMDILVHDSLARLFPELVETAVNNLAQMRNRNSLKYTFKTFTLEEMLDEYRKHKHPEEDEKEGEGKDGKDDKEDKGEGDSKGKGKKKKDGSGTPTGEKAHKSGGGTSEEKSEDPKEETDGTAPKDEHDETDWSKLEKIDDKEFIDEDEADEIEDRINKLKRKRIKLGRLTQKLNGLATTTRERTYRMPSYIQVNKGIILKGKTPGRTLLYLCFDASGSMGSELALFKEIISKAIPQAMDCPCEWFSGYNNPSKCQCKDIHSYDYFKGKFKDIMPVRASGGYCDDGDRTIELCLKAEEKGYTPIGVTDGGGNIYEPEQLKKLKRTILVGPNGHWLQKAKQINPNIQILELDY